MAAVLAALAAGLVPGSLGSHSAAPAAAPAAYSAGTLVQTASGPVCGVTGGGEKSCLDIPYAAPPVGRLRWQPPQPAHPWTATYRATQRGPGCISPAFPSGGVQPGTSEDCLYLEVQEPASARPGQKLPVMFEIHGGGFLGEYRDDNGQNLVSAGPAIYVYAGYRLGILGFLADKALGLHSGDYGLQDQQAALRWVQGTSPGSAATRTT